MTTDTLEKPVLHRAQALKTMTQGSHARLDDTIMARRPFESLARYGLLLQVQYLFHRDIDALYDNPELELMLPDLENRRRFPLIVLDLEDLGIPAPVVDEAPVFTRDNIDLPTALGWLYVAEGSNLGAAFLLKAATGLGLCDHLGARHLGAAPAGRGLHWRSFTAALDAPDMDEASEARVSTGAQAAFARVRALVNRFLPHTPQD